MHPTLQILDRHQSEISQVNVHWFDLPEPSALVKSDDKIFNLSWTPNNQADLNTEIWPTAAYNILFYPKAKDRLDWWLDALTGHLIQDQKLWIVGENDGGIKSLPKRVADYFDCFKIDSARHCVIFELAPKDTNPPTPKPIEFQVDDLKCTSLAGVFSAGRLDKGSEVLLGVLPELKGDILEFGGGCGVLTAKIAQQKQVKKIDSVEVDLLAVRSSNLMFAENKLNALATCIWSDGTLQLPKKRYDHIVTNPPFHKGTRTEYGATEKFFTEAHEWVKTGGKFIWVANDFLTYQHYLKENFHEAQLLVQMKGFKVYSATRK